MDPSKITLGTAQLGLEYGIANRTGKPDEANARAILDYAWNNGINSFDTAPAYGNSEEIIGRFIDSRLKSNPDIVVISKLPGIPEIESFSKDMLLDKVRNQVIQSLKSLKIKTIPFYLLHRPKELFTSKNILLECLLRVQKEGLIDKIGVSIYDPSEVEQALTYKELKAIQIPINVFDHRLIDSGLLARLEKKKFVVFARSVYLQGLFMLPIEGVPKHLERAKAPLSLLKDMAKRYELDVDALCFSFVRDLDGITSIVTGAEKIEQVARNCAILKQIALPGTLKKEIMETFCSIPEDIINPSKWNK
jgi:aryl-alcohol dehydrogenase-like predicted oxidoreductase